MELRHLRYFMAVAETLNFSRAAGRVRVAQPALSRQIHDLEVELGFRLFERSTAKVRLTEAGLMQLDIAITAAQRIAKGTTGNFRIGTGWGAAELGITDAARELHQRHPEISIDFVELPAHEQAQAMRDRRIDVGFASGTILAPRKDFDRRLIYTCAIKLILPRDHPMAGRKEVHLRDLKEERWITISEEEVPGAKALVAHYLKPGMFTPKFGRSARSFQGILAFVGTGEGIALLPELFLPTEPAGLRYAASDCASFEMYSFWSKAHVSTLLPAYLEILREKITSVKTPSATPRRTVRT